MHYFTKTKKALSLLLSSLIIAAMIPFAGVTAFASENPTIESEGTISETHDGVTLTQNAEWTSLGETQANIRLGIFADHSLHQYRDIIYVIDNPGSGEQLLNDKKAALIAAVDTVETIDNELNASGESGQSRLALITWGSTMAVSCDFTYDHDVFKNVVNSLTVDTSHVRGDISNLIHQLANSRTDTTRTVDVIFIGETGRYKRNVHEYESRYSRTFAICYGTPTSDDGLFSYGTNSYTPPTPNNAEELLESVQYATSCSLTRKLLSVKITAVFSDEFKRVTGKSSENHYINGNVFETEATFLSDYHYGLYYDFIVNASDCDLTYIPLFESITIEYKDNGDESYQYESFVIRQNHFTVTYDLNGAVGDVPVDNGIYRNYSNAMAAPITTTRPGYTFGGWHVSYSSEHAEDGVLVTDTGEDKAAIAAGDFFAVRGNTVLTAIWMKANVSLTTEVPIVIRSTLLPPASGDYSDYKANIVSAKFLMNSDFEPDTPATHSWDVSESQDNTIIADLILNQTATDAATAEAGLTEATDATTRFDLVFHSSGEIILPANMSEFFKDYTALESVDFESAIFDNVTDMHGLFSGDQKLTTVTMLDKNVNNVTDMSYMFYLCLYLDTLNINQFDTSNVTNMSWMFGFIGAEISHDFSNVISMLNTSKVTNMSHMFYLSDLGPSFYYSNFNTSAVTDMSYMFCYTQFVNFDISNFDTSNVTNMSYMFAGMSKLPALNLTNIDTSNVTNMSGMFLSMNLDIIDLSSLNTENVTDMSRMFQAAATDKSTITSFDVSCLDMSKVTNMSYMFDSRDNLTSIIFGDNNSNVVTDVSGMFNMCRKLKTIDFGGLDFNNVTTAKKMFYDCDALTSIDLSNESFRSLTDAESMFHNCSSLTNVDLGNTEMTNIEITNYMFYNCTRLQTVDLSGMDTTNLTSAKNMFYKCSSLVSVNFSNCIFSGDFTADKLPMFSFPSNKLTSVYMYNVTKQDFTTSANFSRPGVSSTNLIVYTNDNMFFSTLLWYNVLSKYTNSSIVYNEPTEVLGVADEMIEVSEGDYVIYNITVKNEGIVGANSELICVADTIPDGLTYVDDYFASESYADAGMPSDITGYGFWISKNAPIVEENYPIIKNASDLFTTYPRCQVENGKQVVRFAIDKLPSGSQITVRVACRVEPLAEGENGKMFSNTSFFVADLTQSYSDTIIHYVSATGENTPDLHTVTYEYTGNVPPTTPPSDEIGYENSIITLPESPVAEGYLFNGWTVTDSANNSVLITNNTFVLSDDVTVSGDWSIDSSVVNEIYFVNYEYEGMVPNSVPSLFSVPHKSNETVALSVPDTDEYTFVGWYSDDVEISPDQTFIMPAQNVVVKGTFDTDANVITYLVNGITASIDTAYADESVILPAPPNESGKTFYGWYSEDVTFENNSFVMPEADVTIYGYNATTTGETINLLKGEVATIESKLPAGYENYVWRTVNPAIAAVDGSNITGVEYGTTNIIGFNSLTNTAVEMAVRVNTAIGLIGITTMCVGDEQTLITAIDDSIENATVNYVSSAPEIASVDETGKVVAITEGTVSITASIADTEYSSTFEIIVSDCDISISSTSQTLYIGYTYDVEPVITGAPINNRITYTSDNTDIVTVDENGVVTALENGSAKITATLDINGKSDFINIVVDNYAITLSDENGVLTNSQALLGSERNIVAQFTPALVEGLSDDVVYSLSNPAVATIDESGKITFVKCGNTTVTATLESTGATAEANYNIVPDKEYVITITPTIIEGGLIKLNTSITPELPTSVNNKFEFICDPEEVATVDENEIITFHSEDPVYIEVQPSAMPSLNGEASISYINVYVGKSEILLQTQDESITEEEMSEIIAMFAWTSENQDIATIDASGNVMGIKEGVVIISGTNPEVIPAYVIVNVHDYTVTLNHDSLILTEGDTEQITVSVQPTPPDTGITFSSEDNSIATVDENGNVTAVKKGSTNIVVVLDENGKTVKVPVTVEKNIISVTGVTLNAENITLDINEEYTLISTINPDDATDTGVTYASSDDDVATVDDNGKITAIGEGTATITVTTDDGNFTDTCEVTVVVPVTGVTLNFDDIIIDIGESETLIPTINPDDATDTGVIYTSSDDSVATVDDDGKITAIGEGTTTITVTTDDGNFTDTCEVTVVIPVTGVTLDCDDIILAIGETEILTLTINPGDATDTSVTYTSSDDNVATVDEDGKITAIGEGTATITVTTDNGNFTDTCEVTVVVPVTGVTLNFDDIIIGIGENETIIPTINPDDATDTNVIYTSSDDDVATVDEDGKITAIGEGTTTITVTTDDGNFTDTCEVTVFTPVDEITFENENIKLIVKDEKTIAVTVDPIDADYINIAYASSNESVVTVDETGKVIAKSVGESVLTATITLPDESTKTATTTVTVENYELTINGNDKMYLGDEQTIGLSISPELNESLSDEITYTTSNSAVVTVDEDGVITAVGIGSATITATLDATNATKEFTIIVKDYDVSIDDSIIDIAIGQTDKPIITVIPEIADLIITYTSDNEDVAVVDEDGTITAVGVGETTITANIGDTDKVVVIAVSVKNYNITLTGTHNMYIGEEQTVNIAFSPELAETIDNAVEYTSSNATVATVDANGKITAIGKGSAVITATLTATGATKTFAVTVRDYNMTANTDDVTLKIGTKYVFGVSVNPIPVNDTIIYASSNDSIATVDENGKITAISEGVVTITATLEATGKTITITVNVENYEIVVTSGRNEMVVNTEQTINVSTDTSLAQGIDGAITFTSNNPAVATIDETGKVEALTEGTTTITITMPSTGATKSFNILVRDFDIEVNTDDINVFVDQTSNINARVTPANDAPDITYESSNTSVAVVDSNGKVTGKALGTADITLSLPNGKTKVIHVSVTLDTSKTVPVVLGKSGDALTYTCSASIDGGITWSEPVIVWNDSTITCVKGAILRVTVNSSAPHSIICDLNKSPTTNNTAEIIVAGSTLIYATPESVPDLEESLSIFQKIMKIFKDLFAKIAALFNK